MLTGSYSISNIFLLPKLVAEMFLRFHSMLWLSDSYDDTTPPTLAFSIFKGFCLNISIFPHFFTQSFVHNCLRLSISKYARFLVVMFQNYLNLFQNVNAVMSVLCL